jgi:hypothetical protein
MQALHAATPVFVPANKDPGVIWFQNSNRQRNDWSHNTAF